MTAVSKIWPIRVFLVPREHQGDARVLFNDTCQSSKTSEAKMHTDAKQKFFFFFFQNFIKTLNFHAKITKFYFLFWREKKNRFYFRLKIEFCHSVILMVFLEFEQMVKRGAKNIGRLESSFGMENYDDYYGAAAAERDGKSRGVKIIC